MKKWIYNRKRIQAHRKGRSVYVISVLHTTWSKLQNLTTLDLLSKLFITVRQRSDEGYVVSPILSVSHSVHWGSLYRAPHLPNPQHSL